jgi:ABC-type branched-subunit amino acid transport system permease subunit
MTFLGGLVIGLAAQFARGYLSSDVLAGLPSSVPFIVLFAALVLMPTPPASEDVGARWSATVRSVGPRLRGGGVLAVLGAATLAPLITATRLSSYTSALIYALLFLSLGFLVRVSGQTSLCHAGFAAVGAAAIVQLTSAGVPWGFALPAAAVLAAGVGVAVAVPAIRLSGLFLALATLAFGLMLRNLFYTSSWMFGQNPQSVQRPTGLASDRSYYYLCLGVLVLAVLLVVALQRGRVGRLLQASADAPVALETVGTSVRFLRVIAFAVSAGLAGASGGLLAGLYGSIDGLSFDPFLSMSLLAVLALAGPGTVRAAFIASISFAVIPSYITSSHLSNYLTLVFGAAALLVAVSSTSAAGGRLAAAAAQLARTRSRSPVRARAIRAAEATP